MYDNSIYTLSIKCNKVNKSEPSSNITNLENLPTRENQACPKMRFLDSGCHRTGILTNLSCEPVLGQKMINYEQPDEDNCIKKFENIKIFWTDLKNLVVSKYNCSVDSIPDLVDDFNRRYPGYKRILEYQDLLNEAEKLNFWGWT